MSEIPAGYRAEMWLPEGSRVVFVPPFPDAQVLIAYDTADVRAFYERNGLDADFLDDALYSQACSICDPQPAGSLFIMCLHGEVDEVTVWHESLHMAWHVLAHHGVPVTWEDHEMLAYTQGYIAQQILDPDSA